MGLDLGLRSHISSLFKDLLALKTAGLKRLVSQLVGFLKGSAKDVLQFRDQVQDGYITVKTGCSVHSAS